MKLYHGSDIAIEHPEVAFNKGFSDLGRGFYLTDDLEAARGRAISRARKTAKGSGIVSVFDFDEECLPWVTIGSGASAPAADVFGLRFEPTIEGIVAWANYIKACRRGRTEVEGLGDPSVVRAWIATEEIEMACSGFAPAEALAEFIAPEDLVVQYCFRSQHLIDDHLAFEGVDVC